MSHPKKKKTWSTKKKYGFKAPGHISSCTSSSLQVDGTYKRETFKGSIPMYIETTCNLHPFTFHLNMRTKKACLVSFDPFIHKKSSEKVTLQIMRPTKRSQLMGTRGAKKSHSQGIAGRTAISPRWIRK